VLFPCVALPLHVFEARYREMVRDALASERPLVGISLLRGEWKKDYYGNPTIFAVGCVGEIVRAEPLDDGRFNILLRGLREYRIREGVFEKSYREALVEWLAPPADREALSREVRAATGRLVEAYLEREEEVVGRFADDPAVSDEFFVNFFAFHLDLLPLEKQSLLEARSLSERARRLREVLDFRLTARGWTKGAGGEPREH
jgi:hypothetical protein